MTDCRVSDLSSVFPVESANPFSLSAPEKRAFLNARLLPLLRHHAASCESYARMLKALNCDVTASGISADFTDLPFLPVGLFKRLKLCSVPEREIFKTVTSSGTSGQSVSRIYLDRHNAALQQKVLVSIVSSFLGKARLPLLIIDCPAVIKNRALFSARGAGVLGFSIFGSDRTYALNDDLSLNLNAVRAFMERHAGEKILLFSFTYVLWQYFCVSLEKSPWRPDLSQGILFHGGGWKRLASLNITRDELYARLKALTGLQDIHDYYGMVEQAGSIFVECSYGHLHCADCSDVLTRRERDLSLCAMGEEGIIEVISLLPTSYPGNLLITDDRGVILGEDDCPCGRKGKYFKVTGRLPRAEVRGCSDTYRL